MKIYFSTIRRITDDDVFIWTDDLESSVIHAGWTLTDTVEIKGRCKQKELPVRDQDGEWGKYYISMSDYPFELCMMLKNCFLRYLLFFKFFQTFLVYPPYCSGAGYITSLQAIKRIREQIPYTILVPHVDDVYFGMLAYDAGVNVIHDNRFTTSAEKKWIPCDLFNFHGYNISDGFVKRDYPKNECTLEKIKKNFFTPKIYGEWALGFLAMETIYSDNPFREHHRQCRDKDRFSIKNIEKYKLMI